MSAELVAPGGSDHQETAADSGTATAAFDAVYGEHYDRLRRFVLGMTGQPALAEDIAQETLLRAYMRMETFDFDRPLWPWLKTVATRLVFDNSRAQRRESLEADPAVETATDPFDVTVERHLLASAMKSLPLRQRMAVGLRYLEDWKAAEVAEELGLTRMAAEQLLHRARRRLSTEYAALMGGELVGLRAALWPLLVLVTGVRGRLTRFRAFLGGSAGAQLPMSLEGASQMVAAAAFGGVLFVGGVALAAPADRASALRPSITHASAFHSTEARETAAPQPTLASRETPPRPTQRAVRAVSAKPAVSVARPAGLTTAAAPSAPAPAPATRVTKVEVRHQAPIKQTPAASTASATKQRSAEGYLVRVRGEVRLGENAPAAPVSVETKCNTGAATRAACAATDAVDEALPVDNN